MRVDPCNVLAHKVAGPVPTMQLQLPGRTWQFRALSQGGVGVPHSVLLGLFFFVRILFRGPSFRTFEPFCGASGH
jgi:hypothetical protein